MKRSNESLQRCDWVAPTLFQFFKAALEPISTRTATHADLLTHSIFLFPTLTIFIRFSLMDKAPWYSNFPTPRSTPRTMTNEEVSALLTNPETKAGKDYLIIDVRRTDFGVSP